MGAVRTDVRQRIEKQLGDRLAQQFGFRTLKQFLGRSDSPA